MTVKGHESNVNTWSEVIGLKLNSLCPLQTIPKQDELALFVSFGRIEAYASQW